MFASNGGANIHYRCLQGRGHGNTERHSKELKNFFFKPDTHIPLQVITMWYVGICILEVHFARVLVSSKHRKN